MHSKAKFYIKYLDLQPHPEGGFYKEIFRSDEIINKKFLPKRYDGSRCFSTSIFFLLSAKQKSYFHRLKSDEQWHFYDGCSVKIHLISENGILTNLTLGRNLKRGEAFQTIVKRNSWFAAELKKKDSFALVGCVVAPGFEFKDFELANRDELISKYPEHKQLIKSFTAKGGI